MDQWSLNLLSVPFYRSVGITLPSFRRTKRKGTHTIVKLNETELSKPSLLDVVKSVAASAFGVQSAANREKDFQQQSVVPYIVVGVVFVIMLIVSLMLVVSLVLPD
jgi:hypothetical protein